MISRDGGGKWTSQPRRYSSRGQSMVGQPCLGTACAGGRLGAESFGWLGVCHAGLCSLDWGWTGAAFFQGIYVTRVSEGGPAEIAGLQIGDKIMQVTHVPEEETKAWGRGSGVPEALGVRGYLCLLGNLGSSLKHFGAHAGVAPRREQSLSSVCLHCGTWDPPAQRHQLGRLGGPGPQSPSCFQIPEGRELR